MNASTFEPKRRSGRRGTPDDTVREIRRLARAGLTYYQIAKLAGVARSTCSGIARGLHRADVPPRDDGAAEGVPVAVLAALVPASRRGRPPVIPAGDVARARRLRACGWTYAAIGRELGINDFYVARLVRGECRKDVAP